MINVALIGCGFMGRMHANVVHSLNNAQLVAVIDRLPEKAAALAESFGGSVYTDLAAALAAEKVDAVDICLPTHLHAEATIQAANAGKHVMCEKPMALSLDKADAMTEACRANGVQLMIGHCIRFWPEYALLKKYVESGSLGKLLSVNLTRYGEFPHWSTDNWLADEALSGGGALDMHIHDTDFALFLLGAPDSIDSWGTIDEHGPSHAFTTMQKGDCVAHFEGGWNLPAGTPFSMTYRAIFERGAMLFDQGGLTIYEQGKAPFEPEFPKMSAEGGGNISDLGGYYHELRYFYDCLENNRSVEIVTPETSRLSLETTLSEIKRIKSRKR